MLGLVDDAPLKIGLEFVQEYNDSGTFQITIATPKSTITQFRLLISKTTVYRATTIFASQSSGAAHINTWSALALEEIGGNLQHYSPLIDEGVAQAFNVPQGWALKAQLVFGGIGTPAGPKETRRDLVKVA